MNNAILRLQNISYTYENAGGNPALCAVSTCIYERERIALIGANGSGKSTFLLHLNGVLKANKGEIFYREEKIEKHNIKHLRKKVGLVFQDADYQIVASGVRAEVAFGPMNLRLPPGEVQSRVEEALRYTDMLHLADRAPHSLSGGEKKRLSIADIVAMQPEIILFDEPTASLDVQNIALFESLLAKLQGEQKTILISTHDLDFVYRWANRVLVFSQGSIVADASPLAVFADSALLKKTGLKEPLLFSVSAVLQDCGLLQEGVVPRSPEELKTYIKGGKNV